MSRKRLLVALALASALAACAGRRGPAVAPSDLSARGATAGEPWEREAGAFGVEARLATGGESKRLRLRFYVHAPDQFRVEVRGPVGGIVLVATGRGGAIRLLVPSRRMYAEASLEEDVGSDMIGVPLTGCDFAMVMRISSGMSRFRPCSAQAQDGAAPGPAERPGLIVDTSLSGKELVRFGWDWSAQGEFPREARIEMMAGEDVTTLALTSFQALDYPRATPDDFFWEPIPVGARKVPLGALRSADPP